MKSVGEVMALGRTFPEALNKAVQSLEIGADSLNGNLTAEYDDTESLNNPTADRLFRVYRAVKQGTTLEEVSQASGYDLWFLAELQEISRMEKEIAGCNPQEKEFLPVLKAAKRMGFADSHIARLVNMKAGEVRELRKQAGIIPTFQRVDTCAAEFEAQTPYLYSAYEMEDESRPTGKQKILILGGGPNRIGQGIEFDYCCCQAAFALSKMGYETIMYNCNPETVSTDYDTADRLYFEPLTLEHVLNVIDREQPVGVIVQFGGQTPLNLAAGLEAAGVNILGTSPQSIRLSEDREEFAKLLRELDIPQPENGIARSLEEAREVAAGDRLSGAGPAVVCAGRAGHGDRGERSQPGRVHQSRHRSRSRSADPDRQVHGRCLRDRRGCAGRRRARGHRRDDAAYRRSRCAFRRCGLCAAALQGQRLSPGDHARVHRAAWAWRWACAD